MATCLQVGVQVLGVARLPTIVVRVDECGALASPIDTLDIFATRQVGILLREAVTCLAFP